MNANARYELTDVELTADHPNPNANFTFLFANKYLYCITDRTQILSKYKT